MTHLPSKSPSGFHLVSNHDARLGLPVADDDVYEPFALWLDQQLEELVDRWIHLAAPGASRRTSPGSRRR
ncbi:MAG TPA: hypothetical protein VFI31_25460 [Pirellulales bacterium]|nr:hypothetical protein [Pirellulales bacterium]